jgi:hypothetical protein
MFEVGGVVWGSLGEVLDCGCDLDPSPMECVTPIIVENNGVMVFENPLPTLFILENTFLV